MDRYAVFGNPVEHSQSPNIHSLFAQQTGEVMDYQKYCVSIDAFASASDEFFDQGGRGLNITVPFKLEAYKYAQQLSKRARQAGAVNTLVRQEDGAVWGDNTDGIGMVRDILDNQTWQIQGKTVLLLGAGGAARGVMAPLLEEEPKLLLIVNRNAEKAQQLAQGFRQGGQVMAGGYDIFKQRDQHRGFDLVINATAASLTGSLPPLPDFVMTPQSHCYDMMYAAQDTIFLDWCRQQGVARCADGLGMLVEQAAESFFLWRKVRPNTHPVIDNIRAQLNIKK